MLECGCDYHLRGVCSNGFIGSLPLARAGKKESSAKDAPYERQGSSRDFPEAKAEALHLGIEAVQEPKSPEATHFRTARNGHLYAVLDILMESSQTRGVIEKTARGLAHDRKRTDAHLELGLRSKDEPASEGFMRNMTKKARNAKNAIAPNDSEG